MKVENYMTHPLRQFKWIKSMLESEKLTENVRRTFLQNLKPGVGRAVAEATGNEKDASSEDEESNEEDSNKEESGKGESAGDQSSSDQDSGEGSFDEAEEQEELMTSQ